MNFWQRICRFFGWKVWQKTEHGIQVLCRDDVWLDPDQLDLVEAGVLWGVLHGASIPKPEEQVVIEVVHTGLRNSQGHAYFLTDASPTGKAAGQLLNGYQQGQIHIKACIENLDVIRHEMGHVILWRKKGDVDANHQDPAWAGWGV